MKRLVPVGLPENWYFIIGGIGVAGAVIVLFMASMWYSISYLFSFITLVSGGVLLVVLALYVRIQHNIDQRAAQLALPLNSSLQRLSDMKVALNKVEMAFQEKAKENEEKLDTIEAAIKKKRSQKQGSDEATSSTADSPSQK